MTVCMLCSLLLQKRLQTAQVFGAKSTVRGQELGTASSVAFTPLQGLEIVNPLAAEKKQDVSLPACIAIATVSSFSPPPPPPLPRRQTTDTFPLWRILYESRKLNYYARSLFAGGPPSHVTALQLCARGRVYIPSTVSYGQLEENARTHAVASAPPWPTR